MNDEKRSDEHGTPNAQAWDKDGNVRPADGRWLGDHNDDLTDDERVQLREKEIADADAALERRKAEAEGPKAEVPGPNDGPEPPAPEDRYAGMQFDALRAEAKARDINAGGTADEIKARLYAADAEANSGITPTGQ